MNECLIGFALTNSLKKINHCGLNFRFTIRLRRRDIQLFERTAKTKNVDSYSIQMNNYEAKEIRIKMKERETKRSVR